MDRINKWGLLNSLIEIVNNESSDDPHAILARHFLKKIEYCLEIIYLEYYKRFLKLGAIFEPPIFLLT